MTKLNTWTHPTNGQVRVYINNLPGQRSAKLYAQQCEIDSFGCDWEFRVFSDTLNRGEIGQLKNDAEQFINALAGKSVNVFADLLALAK